MRRGGGEGGEGKALPLLLSDTRGGEEVGGPEKEGGDVGESRGDGAKEREEGEESSLPPLHGSDLSSPPFPQEPLSLSPLSLPSSSPSSSSSLSSSSLHSPAVTATLQEGLAPVIGGGREEERRGGGEEKWMGGKEGWEGGEERREEEDERREEGGKPAEAMRPRRVVGFERQPDL